MVSLRLMDENDAGIVVRWRNDKMVMDGLFSFMPISVSEQRQWFAKTICDFSRRYFIIEHEGQAAGTIQIVDIDHKNKKAEIGGLIVDPEHRGKGIAKDAVLKITDFGFNDLNLHRLELEVFADNDKAVRVYESCGYEREGILKEYVYKNGRFRDVLIMARIRNH